MKRRKTLRIVFSIGILCLAVLWGYAVLSVNRQYRDKRRFIQIEPGQAADINGLEVRAADSGIYDIAAFRKAYEQYNLTEILRAERETGEELGIPKILCATLSVTNNRDTAIDFNDDPGFFCYGFKNGAWYGGTNPASFSMGTLYREKGGILEPGASSEIVFWATVFPSNVPEDRWDRLAQEDFRYILEVVKEKKTVVYEGMLGRLREVTATDAEEEELAASLADSTMDNPDTPEENGGEYAIDMSLVYRQDSPEGEDIPEDTKKHITAMGEEFFINGIGYKVLSAVATDDPALFPECLEDMGCWIWTRVPIAESDRSADPSTYDIGGDDLAYVFIRYEITSYRDDPYVINAWEKDCLGLYQIPANPINENCGASGGSSWAYFDKSHYREREELDEDRIHRFPQYFMQPREKLETTVGFVIDEWADPERWAPYVSSGDHFYLAVNRSFSAIEGYHDQSIPLYDLDKLEFRLGSNKTKEEP